MKKIISVLPAVIFCLWSACDWHFQEAREVGDRTMGTTIPVDASVSSDLAFDKFDLQPSPDLSPPEDCNLTNQGFCSFNCSNCKVIVKTKSLLSIGVDTETEPCQCVFTSNMTKINWHNVNYNHAIGYKIGQEEISVF